MISHKMTNTVTLSDRINCMDTVSCTSLITIPLHHSGHVSAIKSPAIKVKSPAVV